MEKTKVEFHPETEDTSVETVETIHSDSSDMVSDVEISEVRDWLWTTLDEPVEFSELGKIFIDGFGKNNIVIFSRAVDLMRNQGLIEPFRIKEDRCWSNYWIRNEGGDKCD